MHEKRPDIQGLRAWAVLAVVVFHFFPSIFPFGYLGVDVFFVLSGYLIAMVLERNPSSISTLSNFYMKRAKRIVPLAVMILSICLIVIALLQSKVELKNSIKYAIYSMFFIKNLQPVQNLEEGYFQALEKATDFFTHFWSLAVEIQFYLLAPLLSYLIPRRPDFARMLFMTTISAGSLFYSLLGVPKDVFEPTPARLWQFLVGSIAFYTESILLGTSRVTEAEDGAESEAIALSEKKIFVIHVIFALGTLVNVVHYGSMASVVVILFQLTNLFRSPFFEYQLLFPLRVVVRVDSVLLNHKTLQLIGNASYSLYLIHWPIVCLLEILELHTVSGSIIALGSKSMGEWEDSLRMGFSPVLILYLSLSIRDGYNLIGCLCIFAFGVIDIIMIRLLFTQSLTVNNITPVLWEIEANVTLTKFEIDQTNDQMERDNWKILNFNDCIVRDGGNPFGFCDLKASINSRITTRTRRRGYGSNGSGSFHFMVMGNSYTPNLGAMVQEHFATYYGRMQSRAVAECEPLVPKNDVWCLDYTVAHAKFDADVDRERPDVLLLISRYIKPEVPLSGPIENDTLYQFIESRVEFFEERVKKKIFIMQAFDRPGHSATLEKRRLRKGLSMTPYMPEGIEADPTPMRERIRMLAKRCTKCIIFDIQPAFLNEAGNFTVLDRNLLRFFDEARHLTIIGRNLIEPIFKNLGENYTRLLESSYPENIAN